jgi:hypothetical protein
MVRWRDKKQRETRDEAEAISIADWMHGLSPSEWMESNPSLLALCPKK